MTTAQFKIESYIADSFIMVEGKKSSNCFYIIRSGKVKVSKESPVLYEEPFNVFGPGDFFGVVSCMSGRPREESAVALESTSLICVEKDMFGLLIQKNPTVAMKIIRFFSRKLRQFDHAIISLTLNTAGEENPAHLYNIGEFYSEGGIEGIVYKIYDNGRRGMIVSMGEATRQWSVNENVERGCSSDDDGAQNMATIQCVLDWENKYPAFGWCNNIRGWYLPAIDELRDIYEAKDVVNQALRNRNRTEIDGEYWSSTEFNNNAAKYWNFSTGTSHNPQHSKKDPHKVRAVRKF